MSIRKEQKQHTHQRLIDAVLQLTRQGYAFNNMSLRQITHTVGLAPATFYRHFANMDQLGLELIDHIALYLKNIIGNICKMAIRDPESHQLRLNYLLKNVSTKPEYWEFFIRERSSHSLPIRQAIQREVNFLNEDTLCALQQISHFQHIQNADELKVFAEMFTHFSFCWAMEWLDLHNQPYHDQLQQQCDEFEGKALLQLKVLYQGIKNWH